MFHLLPRIKLQPSTKERLSASMDMCVHFYHLCAPTGLRCLMALRTQKGPAEAGVASFPVQRSVGCGQNHITITLRWKTRLSGVDSKLCGWSGRRQCWCHQILSPGLTHSELCSHFQFPRAEGQKALSPSETHQSREREGLFKEHSLQNLHQGHWKLCLF